MGASSAHRLARATAINASAPIKEVGDIRTVLGDTADPHYPLYRNASPPDDSATAAMALFDLDTRMLSVFLANPKTSAPAYRLAIGCSYCEGDTMMAAPPKQPGRLNYQHDDPSST